MEKLQGRRFNISEKKKEESYINFFKDELRKFIKLHKYVKRRRKTTKI